MLNRAKVMKELQARSADLFIDRSHEYNLARACWERIVANPHFIDKVRALPTPWLIPSWQGPLDRTVAIAPLNNPYRVVAIDGSQIYPDRHQGTACFLINIGTVDITYGLNVPQVYFDTQPFVYVGKDHADEIEASADLVNCRRQELELVAGLERSKLIAEQLAQKPMPYAFLFDGSLIFWHLESKEQDLKDAFLGRYLGLLHELYNQQVICAGYISLPKNKELVNLMRIELCNFVIEGCTQHQIVDHLVDTAIASFFLPARARTTVFASNAKIGALYPDHLKPYFFYLNVETEIARVEIPTWIAHNEQLVDGIAALLLDQSLKGHGYPLVLAEAHEQAVVKGPDRDFFYQLIAKVGIEQKQRLFMSQKSIKKRGMGI
jgi:hypothetical protein